MPSVASDLVEPQCFVQMKREMAYTQAKSLDTNVRNHVGAYDCVHRQEVRLDIALDGYTAENVKGAQGAKRKGGYIFNSALDPV